MINYELGAGGIQTKEKGIWKKHDLGGSAPIDCLTRWVLFGSACREAAGLSTQLTAKRQEARMSRLLKCFLQIRSDSASIQHSFETDKERVK